MTNTPSLWLALLLCPILVQCKITREQAEQSAALIRNVCQPRTKISTESADGIKVGIFQSDKAFKCYCQCGMEMLGMMKKAKLNYEAAMKQMTIILPPELVSDYQKAITICKDVANGMKDQCEAGWTLLQCMYKNNDSERFIFP